MFKKLIKIFSGVMILVVLSKLLGFVRESFIAARYGAKFVSDIYVFEDGLINALYTVCAGVIGTTYVPKAKSLDEKNREQFTNNYLNILALVIIVVSAFVCIFTPQVLHILLPGFYNTLSDDKLTYIELVTRINMISFVLVFLENYLIVVSQANSYFIFASIQGVTLNLSLIIYLQFFYNYGVLGIVITKILAHLFNIIILLFFLNKKKVFAYRFVLDFKSPHIHEVVRLAMPVFFVNMVSQINYIVDRSMASNLQSGSMALLSYSNTIASMIYSIIGINICSIAYTDISAVQNEKNNMNNMFSFYLSALLGIIVPCCIVMGVDSEQISSIIYGRGKVSTSDIKVISNILLLYIPSNLALSIRDLYNRLLYIHKKTTVPSVVNLSGLLMNIVLNIVLSKLFGAYGLALATSIVCIVTLLITMLYCKKFYTIKFHNILKLIIPTIVTTGLCFVIATVIPSNNMIWKIVIVIISGGGALLVFNFSKILPKLKIKEV